MTEAATTHPDLNIERLPFGSVSCDFIHIDSFKDLCQRWLQEPRLHHIVTLNPEMVMEAEQNTEFRAAVAAADIRVPDGAGLVWAKWYIRSQFWSLLPSLLAFPFTAVERITGVETINLLAKLCAERGERMYLLGGTHTQVTKTAERLRRMFPQLKIDTSPDHQFDIAGPASILSDIQAKAPQVLLVAYGARKQSRWVEHQRHSLGSVRIAVGVGGAFAILSEEKKRAPRWLRQLNLEWLWRLLLEPSRLPRIWQATVRFPLLIKHQKTIHPPGVLGK